MQLTKLSLYLIRILCTAIAMLIIFGYGILQSFTTLHYIGDMNGWGIYSVAMAVVVYSGAGQVQKEMRCNDDKRNNGGI